MTHRAPLLAILTVLAVLAACDDPRSRAHSEAVDSRPAPDAEVERLEISESPIAVIGSTFGPEEQIIDGFGGMAVSPDGDLIVADGGPHPVRLFTRTGEFRRNLVTQGDGPAQVARPVFLGLNDQGHVVVFDGPRRELKAFDLAGTLVQTQPFPVDSLPEAPNPVGLTGGFVLALTSSGGSMHEEGTSASTLEFYVIDPATAAGERLSATRFIELPGRRTYTVIASGRPVVSPYLFEQSPRIAVDETGLVATAPGNSNQITLRDLDGGIVAEITLDAPLEPVTAADREQFISDALDRISDPAQRSARARFLENVPVADAKPVIHNLLFSEEGALWVGLEGDQSSAARTFEIFGRLGEHRFRASLSRDELPLAVQCDVLWTLHRDELEVETIRSYRISGIPADGC